MLTIIPHICKQPSFWAAFALDVFWSVKGPVPAGINFCTAFFCFCLVKPRKTPYNSSCMRIAAERDDSLDMGRRRIKSRFSSSVYECFSWIPVGMSLFCCIALLLVRLMAVSGNSMWPTLHNGDLMLASNLFYEPARGDIIVLNKKGFFNSQPIVKRVIGTGGDEININFEDGTVWVNGELLDEPYIAEPTVKAEGLAFPQTVPDDCIFVMGDNRNHSDDSRDPALGMVDTRCVIGKVRLVLPTGRIAEWMKGRFDHG